MDWQETSLRLLMAFVLGASVGLERQIHHRVAGLRTNILVAVGAAGFTIFGAIFMQGEVPRIVSQIVSGIGFLGAGAIMREGLNVQGLNTAATIWCSAALGIFCGAGFWIQAVIFASFIVVINTVLRRIENYMDKYPSKAGFEIPAFYAIAVECKRVEEVKVRRSIVDHLRRRKLPLKSIEIKAQNNELITMSVIVKGTTSSKQHLQHVMEELAFTKHVIATKWDEQEHKDIHVVKKTN